MIAHTPPLVDLVPPGETVVGDDVVSWLTDTVGMEFDPWQMYSIRSILRTREGTWSAFESALVVPRQNGKGHVSEAIELVGLFLLKSVHLVVHTSHEYKTTREAFNRVKAWVEGAPELMAEVAVIRTGHGEESIELLNGDRIRFLARTSGSGRGFTGDMVVLDEAFDLDDEEMDALLPTLSARPNPMILYMSMAGKLKSEVLPGVRARADAGEVGLCYLEWGVKAGTDLDDRAAWRAANPAMETGRITEAKIARERRALSGDGFARERLNIWSEKRITHVIDLDAWVAAADPGSEIVGSVAFAVDVSPDRKAASLAVAGRRADGRWHVEVVKVGSGAGWVVDDVGRVLAAAPEARGVVLDPGAAAGSLIPGFARAGIDVETVSAREMGQATGALYSGVVDGVVVHLGQPALDEALKGAGTRKIGEAWGWSRRDTSVDITPLVAVTLALYLAGQPDEEPAREYSGRVMAL